MIPPWRSRAVSRHTHDSSAFAVCIVVLSPLCQVPGHALHTAEVGFCAVVSWLFWVDRLQANLLVVQSRPLDSFVALLVVPACQLLLHTASGTLHSTVSMGAHFKCMCVHAARLVSGDCTTDDYRASWFITGLCCLGA